MKYIKPYDSRHKSIWHECSIPALINIIRTSHFEPRFKGELNYDSCLNCYSEENRNVWNATTGSGATLKLIWSGEILEVDDHLRTPFPKDVLFINPTWRSFIAIRSDSNLCKIVGFEINDQDLLLKEFSSSFSIISIIPCLKSLLFFIWKTLLLKKLIKLVDDNQSLTIK